VKFNPKSCAMGTRVATAGERSATCRANATTPITRVSRRAAGSQESEHSVIRDENKILPWPGVSGLRYQDVYYLKMPPRIDPSARCALPSAPGYNVRSFQQAASTHPATAGPLACTLCEGRPRAAQTTWIVPPTRAVWIHHAWSTK
jgi:hypothetical protein